MQQEKEEAQAALKQKRQEWDKEVAELKIEIEKLKGESTSIADLQGNHSKKYSGFIVNIHTKDMVSIWQISNTAMLKHTLIRDFVSRSGHTTCQ